jgi:hypothetical protein
MIPTADMCSAAASQKRLSASDDGVCIICLDNDPRPIQSGCACRGDAGLAHVECRALSAAHPMTSSKSADGWWKCATCKQEFTGAMQLGLAEAWWSMAQHLPEEHDDRLEAATVLGRTLFVQGKYVKAETMFRDVLTLLQRFQGPEHPITLSLANDVAVAMKTQGKHAEAEAMFREVLAVQRRVIGPDNRNTLLTVSNLAASLSQ